MRQPHAQRTDRELLDQCYVYCNNVEVGTVVEQVKKGLEAEGLTGLDDEVMGSLTARGRGTAADRASPRAVSGARYFSANGAS